ncbi:hypothetical protein ACTG9Q_22590 [Actinokineospora sp. 24-640]
MRGDLRAARARRAQRLRRAGVGVLDDLRPQLREAARLLGVPDLAVRRRWTGVYASAPGEFLTAAPHPTTRVVSVTSGIGMTTAFGLAPATLDDLLTPR